MAAVLADTHAVVWYFREQTKLSAAAITAFEQAGSTGDLIYLSAITIIEITYLIEKGKLPQAALDRLDDALAETPPLIAVLPIEVGVARAVQQVPRDLVPDMPDRIITATALYLNLPLITRDAKIRSTQINTIW